MRKRIIVCFISLSCLSFLSMAQITDVPDNLEIEKDSVLVVESQKADSIVWIEDKLTIDDTTQKLINTSKVAFKPNPNKAVLYSAIFPGLGQIYNRKYWKLPIIYGGFLGLTYAISWNGRYYNDYTNGYKALMSDNPKSKENIAIWSPFVKGGRVPENMSDAEILSLSNSFQRSRDSYRRYRDLSIIGVVALYALCMIDAYVDAHLFDFDISPDLSLRVEPTSMDSNNSVDKFSGKSFGVQCSFQF